jgi:glycosyltransferase involved in cell wall biosynthesis
MRLGGFVIHGDSVETLGACLDALRQVCDEIVAVDSMSNDGSSELAAARGIRTLRHPWEGFGAARALAAKALSGSDYLFFLDSDEYLRPEAVREIHAWRDSSPTEALYRVRRRNWAELSGRRFLYRTDTRARLIRYDAASWTPQMIVHEALSSGRHPLTRVVVEHHFARSLEGRLKKDDEYALLWAIRAFGEGRRPKPYWVERYAHLFRDLLIEGALFRGGAQAIRLAWVVSRYHAQKQTYLRGVRAGKYEALLSRFRAGEYASLFGPERHQR